MENQKTVTTRFTTELDYDANYVEQLSIMINQAYDEGESGMWQHAGTRTNPGEVEHLMHASAIVVAEVAGGLVGSVSVTLVDEGVGGFGMLVAARAYRALGVGSALVTRAENWARQSGCHTMQLELLTPRHWRHPNKQFLEKWYFKIGYRPKSTEPFEIMYPHLAPLLATDCDFTVWQKLIC